MQHTATGVTTAGIQGPLTPRFARTTYDGFGRTVKVEAGDNGTGTTLSRVDTQYAPCACSPLGKMSQVSSSYKPGEAVVWTKYQYDASGRTTQVTAPDGASATTYVYQGNQTTVMDAAGKWKKYTTDAMGSTPGDSITSIVENPSQFAIYARNGDGSVSLAASAQRNLNSALGSNASTSACEDLAWALTLAFGMWGERNDGNPLYLYNGLILTGFNSFNPPHSSASYEQKAGSFGDANAFYGVSD